MAQVINTNVMSLNAQRNLAASQTSLATAMQRLSSGLRINSAKDDAAGMAISERFTTQIRGLNQAARNANDGISLSQTAEGALGTMTENFQRIRELAIQSANSTNSESDRAALDQEVQQRLAEIERIASQTSFNGQKILDGSFGTANFQVGANVGETISIDLQTSTRTNVLGKIAKAESADLSPIFSKSIPAADIGASYTDGNLSINGTAINTTPANTADAAKLAAAINAVGGVTATATNTTAALAFDTLIGGATATNNDYSLSITVGSHAAVTISVTDAPTGNTINATSLKNLIGADSTLTGYGLTVTESPPGSLVFSTADGSNITLNETVGSGFASGTAFNGAATADTYRGKLGVTSNTEDPIVVAGTAPGNAITGLTAGTYGKLNLDSNDLSIQVGTDSAVSITGEFTSAQTLADKINETVDKVHASIDSTGRLVLTSTEALTLAGDDDLAAVSANGTTSGLGFSASTIDLSGSLTTVNVKTVEDANEAIYRVDNALTAVSTLRSTFGAIQNRFESTIANLNVTAENTSASRSRIMDADFAVETANLSRAQILQQAGTAMVAQANQVPQAVLQLLK